VLVHRTTRYLAAIASLGLLAGCGGSGSSSTPTPEPKPPTAVVHATHPYAARSHLSPHAQFVAAAGAVNLQPADVPGFTASTKHKSRSKTHPFTAQYKSCLHFTKEVPAVYHASSKEFEAQAGLNLKQTFSEVKVMLTAAAARRELATWRHDFQDRAVTSCLSRAFDVLGGAGKTTHANGVTVKVSFGGLHVTQVPVEAATGRTGGGVGVNLSMKVTYHVSGRGRHAAIPDPMYLDALMFIVGRAGVSLGAVTLGAPFPAPLEARLFSTLVSRAVSAGERYPALGAATGSSPS
jgi:hypothetical protein